jgi:hypothetical protein
MQNYGDFQRECASMGFIETPLSLSQWLSAWRSLNDAEEVYGVACDVAAGVFFPEAVSAKLLDYLFSLPNPED